jgi:tetratricopeptide (TPR) repeat protein
MSLPAPVTPAVIVLLLCVTAVAVRGLTELDMVVPDQNPGPTNYSAHVDRALEYERYADWRHAAYEWTLAIEKAPSTIGSKPQAIAWLYVSRAHVFNALHASKLALADCLIALKLNPRSADAYDQEHFAFSGLHDCARAIQAEQQALKLFPKAMHLYLNSMAWIHATCPDAHVRDGKVAVAEATRACEATRWKDGHLLDTLAAAYAEAADFTKAIECEQRAMSRVGRSTPIHSQMDQRLAVYKQRRPYREIAGE